MTQKIYTVELTQKQAKLLLQLTKHPALAKTIEAKYVVNLQSICRKIREKK
tara:strand:- start:28 stop:180 length:153 start_codon:yes stop_codon:yes gene_type:complete